MTVSCRYHCRACGKHFTSEGGFDSHLVGTPGSRTCGEPKANIPVNEGICDISEAKTLRKQTIYGGAAA